MDVHASLHSPLFPQVRFPRVYMQILPHPLFRRYGSHGCTCEFALASFSAGTISMDVHANSPSPPFPQVRFPWVYVRILPHLPFRRYYFRGCTCKFSLTPFSAGTVPMDVHASLHSPPFPQVRFPWMYMQILLHLLFRRYGSHGCTCEFSLTFHSAGTEIKYSLLRLVTRLRITTQKRCLYSSSKKCLQAI